MPLSPLARDRILDPWLGPIVLGAALLACATGCRQSSDWSAYYHYDPEVRIRLGQLVRRGDPGFDLAPRSSAAKPESTDSHATSPPAPDQPRPRPKSILNLGDSISFSDCFIWPERTRINRPGMLSSEGYVYFPKAWGAKSGETSAWGRANARAALQRARPEFATILFGTNDLLHGRTDVDAFIENIDAIVEACFETGAIPILFAIPPADGIAPERLAAFNNRLGTLAIQKHIPYIRTDRLFFDAGGYESLCTDGVHPALRPDESGGYDYINFVFRKLLKQIEADVLDRLEKPRQRVPLGTETNPAGLPTNLYDTNRDSQPDVWEITQRDGSVLEEYDSDYDGAVDVRWHFEMGYLMSGEEDMARDGRFSVPFVLTDGWKNETP